MELDALLFQGSNEAFPFRLATGLAAGADAFFDAFPDTFLATAFASFAFDRFFGCKEHFEYSVQNCCGGKQEQCCRNYNPVVAVGQFFEMTKWRQSGAKHACVRKHRQKHAGADRDAAPSKNRHSEGLRPSSFIGWPDPSGPLCRQPGEHGGFRWRQFPHGVTAAV